jgi:SAM-dependent methyltransferase
MTEITGGLRSILSHPAVYELFSRLVGGERARRTLIAEHVRPSAGDRILDIGCGPGELLTLMPSDVRYVGVDISDAYIDRARDRFGNKAEFHVGDASTFSPGERRFDLVLAIGVLHHLDDHQTRHLLQMAGRALAPEGRAVTVDGVYAPGQSPVARAIIDRDRGQHVRTLDGYEALAGETFSTVQAVVRHDLLRIPYSLCILESSLPRSDTAPSGSTAA